MLTRRAALSTLVAAATLPAGLALAQQPATLGAIRVEISPTVVNGWGENAFRIRDALARRIAELAGPVRRGAGPTLHVYVKGVWLSSFAGGSGGGRPTGGGGSNDNFDSEVTLVGGRGEVLRQFPILSVVDSGSGGAWYRPDVDQRRVEALIDNNARWIARYLGH